MFYKYRQSGFTIVEMLVAISIALLMMIIVGIVYQKTGNAVSRGIGLSNIIANNRGINGIIDRDSKNMVGHSGKGFLVIVNHAIKADMPKAPNSNHPIPSNVGSYTNGMNGFTYGWDKDNKRPRQHQEWIRDDQIVFVRQRGGNYPIYPLALMKEGAYSNTDPYHIIVWYGHGVRTNKYGNFKNQPSDYWQLGIDSNGRNRLASQWIFGRQAMFLIANHDNLPDNNTVPYSTGEEAVLPKGQVTNWHIEPFSGVNDNYMDTNDVAYFAYNSNNDNGKVIGSTSSPDSDYDPILNADTNVLSLDEYKQRAFKFLYTGDKRLRINLTPHYEKNSNKYSYAPWQTAQMHGALTVNVSDIEIAFAADITQPGGGDPDDKIDRVTDDDTTSVIDKAGLGTIKWYVSPGFQNTPGDLDSNNGKGYNPAQPITFAIPTGISYPPLADSLSPTNGPQDHATEYSEHTFVWRHDADNNSGYKLNGASHNFWPYLIRIRYRMHDYKGNLTSGYHRQGMWFEQIIKVLK